MKAVVFVDVQKDFIDGALRNEKAIEVTPKIVEFAKECAAKNYKLYATRDTHEKTIWEIKTEIVNCDGGKQEKEFAKVVGGYFTTLEGKKLPVEHCVEGTDGWMIDDRLMEVLEGKCTFVNKPTFGSFDLAEIINEDFFETYQYCEDYRCPIKCRPRIEGQTLDEIILVGFCTDICCVSCALLLRAKFPNTKITIKKDLCAGTTIENHEAALKVMQSCQIDIE